MEQKQKQSMSAQHANNATVKTSSSVNPVMCQLIGPSGGWLMASGVDDNVCLNAPMTLTLTCSNIIP